LQKWSEEKTGIFRFQNPIWQFDAPKKELCFRFSTKFQASHWLALIFGRIKVSQTQKNVWKTNENANPPKKPKFSFANSDRFSQGVRAAATNPCILNSKL